MAQRKKTEVEFIQDTFCPNIAVLCSYDAEVICRKNNLTFVELVQPFCRLTGENRISDPSNNQFTITNLRVEVKDINYIPPIPALAKKLLYDTVTNSLNQSSIVEKALSVNGYNLNFYINTPWFEAWRECFFKIEPPSDHDFLKHYLACIFVVSTSHIDPLDQFQKLLTQEQPMIANKSPKWFSNNIYKYFVLLHDAQEGEISKAHQIYETLKQTYGGLNCHLLQINSKSPNDTTQNQFDPWLQYCKYNEHFTNTYNNTLHSVNDHSQTVSSTLVASQSDSQPQVEHPLLANSNQNDDLTALNGTIEDVSRVQGGVRHGTYLAASDQDRIKTFMSEFVTRGLVPWADKYIKQLYDQSGKISKGFKFNLPKKLFGSSSTSASGASGSGSRSLTHSSASTSMPNMQQTFIPMSTQDDTAPEIQQRRLADLAFVFRLYDLAYNSYYQCKKEFSSDGGSVYLAAALEMLTISNFMQIFASTTTTSTTKPIAFNYIDEAIHIFFNICKNRYYATRTTLLCTEILKANNVFVKAASQYINMISDETDICHALFFEQAALCYLAAPQMPMIRKFAFNMAMAGFRFNRTGQRKHALRVYLQALETYKGHDWQKIENHINFILSRLNFNLRNITNALVHIEHILQKSTNEIIELNEINIIKDFILYTNHLTNERQTDDEVTQQQLPNIQIPFIDSQQIKLDLISANYDQIKYGQILANSIDFSYREANRDQWRQYEEQLYIDSFGKLGALFHHQQQLYDGTTDNGQMPKMCELEKMRILLNFKNPFKISILIRNVQLLWKFCGGGDAGECTNELADYEDLIENELLAEVLLEPREMKYFVLNIRPKTSGQLTILGVKYQIGLQSFTSVSNTERIVSDLQFTLNGKQLFKLKTPTVNSTQKRLKPDNRFNIRVIPKTPLLQVEFESFPTHMLYGEIKQIKLYFHNLTNFKIKNIKIASNYMNNLCFDLNQVDNLFDPNTASPILRVANSVANTVPASGSAAVAAAEAATAAARLKKSLLFGLNNIVLNQLEMYELSMWLCVPDGDDGGDEDDAQRGTTANEQSVDFMFYYENDLDESIKPTKDNLKYRVIRFTRTITLEKSFTTKNSRICKTNSNDLFINLEIANQIQSANTNAKYEIVQLSSLSKYWNTNAIYDRLDRKFQIDQNQTSSIILKGNLNEAINAQDDKSVAKYFISNSLFDQSECLITSLYKEPLHKLTMSVCEKSGDELLVCCIIIWKMTFEENQTKYGLLCKKMTSSLLNKTAGDTANVDQRPYVLPIQPTIKIVQTDEANVALVNESNKYLNISSHYELSKKSDLDQRLIGVITLHIRNISADKNWQLLLQVNNVNNFNRASIVNLNKRDQYVWIGTSAKYIHIKANETKTCKFKLCFFNKGIYQIGQKFLKYANSSNNLENLTNDLNDLKLINQSLNGMDTSTTTALEQSLYEDSTSYDYGKFLKDNEFYNNSDRTSRPDVAKTFNNAINVFLKKTSGTSTNDYVFYKQLNPSFIIVP